MSNLVYHGGQKEPKEIFLSLNKESFTGEQLNILQLHLIEDLTPKQIADQLNIPVTQAQQKIAKAIYQLKKIANDPEYLKAQEILYGRHPVGRNDHDDHHHHSSTIKNNHGCS